MEIGKSEVLIQLLLILRNSGDVFFLIYALWLRGYTTTILTRRSEIYRTSGDLTKFPGKRKWLQASFNPAGPSIFSVFTMPGDGCSTESSTSIPLHHFSRLSDFSILPATRKLVRFQPFQSQLSCDTLRAVNLHQSSFIVH